MSSLILTCEERRYIGRTTLDFDTEAILRYFLVGYLILLVPFSTCLNGFLIILMVTIKSLHQTVYFLTLQVVVLDFGLSIFALSITIANAIAGKWTFDPTFCSLSIFVIHLLLFLPVALDCEVFSRVAFYCTGGNGCTNTNVCQSSRLLTVTLTNIMGSFVPLVLYIILFLKAKMLQKSIICDSDDSIRRQNTRHNTTFFFLFLALFGVNIIPFFFFIVGNSILSILSIPPTSQYVIATIIFRSLYNILPLIDAIAIIISSDFRQAVRLFKSKLVRSTSNSDSSIPALHL